MAANRPFRVKPVRRYRIAKYPSYRDPDPTQHPYPVPFPYSPKLLAAVASAGLTASCAYAPAQTISQGNTPPNPFTVAKSGLPYRTSPYGTGQPQRIDSELARRAIRRVFEQEGYKLQPSYHYMHDHVAFIADGFDVAKKVGFVFADWKNLDTDAVISWMDFRKPDVQIALIRREFEALDPTDAAKLDEYLGSQGSEQLNREIATARAIEDPEARKTAIAAALQKAASRQIHGLEQEARGTTESGDDLVELLGRYNVVGAEVEKAKAIADPKARRRVLSELVERAQKRRISLAEMQRLENRKPSDKNFVAVISDFDDRFNVSSWGDEWESMATLRSIPDPVKRNAALVAAQEQAARKALDRLEQSVREYIAWARSQGAQ